MHKLSSLQILDFFPTSLGNFNGDKLYKIAIIAITVLDNSTGTCIVHCEQYSILTEFL